MKAAILILFCSMAGIAISHAISPLGPPTVHSVESKNAKFQVISDPDNGTKCIHKDTGKILWKIPKWYRHIFVSNDGRYLVTTYDGGHLIPVDSPKELILVTIFTDGEVSKEIKLGDLISDVKTLRENMGNYDWGRFIGFDENGAVKIKVGANELALIDPKTGNKISQEKKEGKDLDELRPPQIRLR